jgi:preprotein translocase subunit SecD
MHSRTRLWLSLIVGLFVLTFLIGFQPIRHPAKEVVPEASFEFKFDQPLVSSESEQAAKVGELTAALKAGGFSEGDLESVQIEGKDKARIKTYALDRDMMAQDEKNLLKALQAKYQGVQAVGRVEETPQEKPLFSLGSALAVYRPAPKVKLGLDLQGGLHVVLRCLPYASMTFATPEDRNQPMYAVAPVPTAGGATPPPAPDAPTISRAELEKRATATLVRGGLAKEAEVKADAVSPNRLVVRTQAADERTAKAQRAALTKMLQEMYPKYAIDPSDADFEVVPIAADTADKVKNIIDKRLFSLGEIREPVIQKQGKDQIIVEIPGVKDPDRVAGILKSTAMLEFRLIPQQYDNASGAEGEYTDWKDKRSGQVVGWDRVLAESRAEFKGSDLVPTSNVVPGNTPGSWEVTFELKANRKKDFLEFTRKSVGRFMAIVLDGKCQMAPVIKSPIPGSGVIEGNFTVEEAGDLRLLLNAGALPVPLEIAENRTVSATLGQDTIARSIRAGLIGLLAVVIFMVIYYRLPGLLADLALLLYVMVLTAVVALSQMVKGVGGITLTLPGVAGVIISIGMAVDANVLIFERMKEELRAGKSMRSAVHAGFDRAWTAIVDSNVTTLITCAVLYFLGTSIIKSFAAMLFIGVACSFFTAVTVSRWLVTMIAESKLGQNPALFGVADTEIRQ